MLKVGLRGNDVAEVQALLKQRGFDPGPVDGIFGTKTEQAVRRFQNARGLSADGIVGPLTYQALQATSAPSTYTVQPGDSLYLISSRFGISLGALMAANPGVSSYDLQIGQRLNIPAAGGDIVTTTINYTYDVLNWDIWSLKDRYPALGVGVAGQSVLGRNLYYLRLGSGPNQVFFNASHHSLEWITTVLLMKFTENFLKAYTAGTAIRGYRPRDIWNRSSIYIIPMVNPDGIELVLNGLRSGNPYDESLIRWNNGSTNFSRVWQANIRGVDLNHNYDASWQLSKQAEAAYGITGPGPTRYSGPYPESEPESRTVADFTRARDFRLVIAYHSQGEVIYWNYQNMAGAAARNIGERFSAVSGYALDETTGIASYAGYKDWFIERYRRPGYTVEVGSGTNPLPISQFPQIYNANEELLLLASVITAS
ncbi:gamma-D-glutamyl-{L}-meso-diaminopimelate peptidase I [Syntrophobotulus glycolicus DSM 8271]|uniref:Gamma-D-glutamyl-(L)-meso-diaminopimelate peptidase I n=2 Tax=Syntrophobotulus TaxID=51196 RepID=F0T1Z5_SYNGF|nr:gamma-D-glutamyl-{L}-meso-diaminopimelate peptidase I [Syntrophobotulus glycolicus DSM 8271]